MEITWLREMWLSVVAHIFACFVVFMKNQSLTLLWSPLVIDIWKRCYAWLNLLVVLPASVLGHFCQHSLLFDDRVAQARWKFVWCGISWVLWNNKNCMVFRGKSFNKQNIPHEILFHTWTWIKNFDALFSYSFVRWCVDPGASIRG